MLFWGRCRQKCPHFWGAFYAFLRTLQCQTKVSKLIDWGCLSNIGDVSKYLHTYILCSSLSGSCSEEGMFSEGAPLRPRIWASPPSTTAEAAAGVLAVPDSLAASKAVNADGAAARESVRASLEISTAEAAGCCKRNHRTTTGEVDKADDSSTAGDEFANVVASKRTNNHDQRRVRGKNATAAYRKEDALAPQTLAAATVAPPAGVVRTNDAFLVSWADWSPARTAATPSSPPDSHWT